MGCGTSVQAIKVREESPDRSGRPADQGKADAFDPSLVVNTPAKAAGSRGWAVVRSGAKLVRGYQKQADGSPNVRLTPRVTHNDADGPGQALGGTPMMRSSSGAAAASWNFTGTGRFALASPGGRFLRNAAMKGDVESIRQTAAEGQDVNEPTRNGTTALVYAIQDHHLPAVKALLELGADTDQPAEDGKCALHYAASLGHEEVLRELLRAGAAVNIKCRIGGRTPLHDAALANRPLIARVLLDFGADPTILDSIGRTALVWATRCGKTEAANELLQWESDRPIELPGPAEGLPQQEAEAEVPPASSIEGPAPPLVMPSVGPPAVGMASPRSARQTSKDFEAMKSADDIHESIFPSPTARIEADAAVAGINTAAQLQTIASA